MVRRAKLYARINEGNGVFSRVAVVFGRNGQAVAPKPRKGAVTSYAVRVGGKFEHAGEDLSNAVTFLRKRQAMIGGGIPEVPIIATDHPADRIPIIEAAEEYKLTFPTTDKAKSTASMYTNTIDSFVGSCRKAFMDEIDRKDILSYIRWMQENLSVRVPGGQNRTIKNRLTYLSAFFSKYGIKLKKNKGADASAPGLLFHEDRPRVVKKKPKKYDSETLENLLDAADIDQRDYLEFLLWSGFRDQEVQYMQYSDFNFKTNSVTVHAKPQFNWKPKDSEERTLVLPNEISKLMKERMGRPQQYPNGWRKPELNDLVFPNADGRPDNHLIKRLHAVAKKVGLNLKGQNAGHMFRKTAGSRVAKKLGLRAAMEFLGHTDPETTALYLAADESTSPRARQAVEEMYHDGD